ncbi:MAG: hypothetical protein MR838_03275, partial [Prevotella sp.]|nr:hypothetical protein [Prevotella sp.]
FSAHSCSFNISTSQQLNIDHHLNTTTSITTSPSHHLNISPPQPLTPPHHLTTTTSITTSNLPFYTKLTLVMHTQQGFYLILQQNTYDYEEIITCNIAFARYRNYRKRTAAEGDA